MIGCNESCLLQKIVGEHEQWLDINKNVLGGPEENYIDRKSVV